MIGFEFFQKIYPRVGELTIFDVGAHYGDSVSEFIELFPMSRVFAFEPDKKNFARLKERFSGEHRVQLLNTAVGDKNGRAQLHRNNYDATHSLLPFNSDEINRWSDANDFREVGVEEVDLLTLDTFCSMHSIAKIDILKLDTQGGELMALQGTKDKLSTQDVGCIFCEVEFRSLYENQPLFWDISAYLTSHAYHFLNIVSPKVTEMGILSWADAIYINDQLWQGIGAKHSAGKLISKTNVLKHDWDKGIGFPLNVRLDWNHPGAGAKIEQSGTIISVVTPPKAWNYSAVASMVFSAQPAARHGVVRMLVSVKEANAGIGFMGSNVSGNFIKRVEILPKDGHQEVYFEFDNLSELHNLVVQTWDQDKSAKVQILEFSVRETPPRNIFQHPSLG